jgi:hypothetical protein
MVYVASVLIIPEVVAAILAVEFVIAVVHFLMDVFGTPDCPIVGKAVIQPNHFHHGQPRAFLKNGVWKNSDIPLGIAIALLVMAWATGVLSWPVWVAAIEIGSANAIHRWAHQTRHKNCAIVNALQDLWIIQRREEHAKHHLGLQNSHYAPITNLLNPLLDRSRFWHGLARLIEAVFGVKPRQFPRRGL